MNIVIVNSSSESIYEQIENQIRDQIVDGTLERGSALPSIRKLARALGISIITVRRAYDDLEREGYIDTVLGKGSFVSDIDLEGITKEKLKQLKLTLTSTVDEMLRLGASRDEIMSAMHGSYKEV